MVVNNNRCLRLYSPSLPDTTKFITNLLLLLHRTIFNGRFGNFIRIVFLYACHLFPEKEASKTEILFFWHSTSTQSVRHHAEKTGRCAKRSAFRFCWSHHHHHSSSDTDRTKIKAEAFTFNVKKPQQEKRAQETFEASSSPSPTNWWAKNARGDDVLTEPTTHRRKRIQVSRVCWDCVDVDHFCWCWWLEWANQRARSTVMLWPLHPISIDKSD